jgi:hypothetical protein
MKHLRFSIVACVLAVATSALLFAAWTYEQSFDALTNGDLNGQDSWSGSTAFDVQSTVSCGGAKSVEFVSGAGSISRAFSATSTADMFFQIRRAPANQDFFLTFFSGATELIYIRTRGTDGTIAGYNSGTTLYVNAIAGFSFDTCYTVNVQWDDGAQPDKWRLRVYSSGAWGSWTAWLNTNSAYSSMDAMAISTEGVTGAVYVDTITATDPHGGGGGGGAAVRRNLTLTGAGGVH